MKNLMTHLNGILIAVLILGWLPQVAGAETSLETLDANKKAVEKMRKEDYAGAERELIKEVGKGPTRPELLYNLGLSLEGQGLKEKAQQAYDQVQKSSAGSLDRSAQTAKFRAKFNTAEMAHKDGHREEALKGYLEALHENPTSIEAKTNIELLAQEMKKQQQQDSKQDPKDQPQQKPKETQDSKENKNKEGQEKKDNKKDDSNKNSKEQDKDKDKSKGEEEKNKKKDADKDQQKDSSGHHTPQPKAQPQPFKGENLSPGDVKKIMEELDRQEQRVRGEYSRKQMKEKPLEKDW
jgi:hypothetical protein